MSRNAQYKSVDFHSQVRLPEQTDISHSGKATKIWQDKSQILQQLNHIIYSYNI